MNLPPHLDLGAATHTGRVRASNEDDYLLLVLPEDDPEVLLCVVADGMGGMGGGGEASRAAVRAWGDVQARAVRDGGEESMRRSFTAAYRRVRERSRDMPSLREMGTTMTGLRIRGEQLTLGHVGDSRALLFRDGATDQLTADHALVGAEHVLTRCIGAGQEEDEPDLVERTLRPGDCLLLCSDGLWGAVPTDRIRSLLVRRSAQEAARLLVRAAVAAGGHDNATAVVIRVAAAGNEGPGEVEIPTGELDLDLAAPATPGSLRGPRWPWLLLALAAAVAAAALAELVWGVDPWRWAG